MLVMLSIIPSIVSTAALAVSPCYITTISLHLVLGTLERKLYNKKILYQASKIQSIWKLRFRVYPENKGEAGGNAKRLAYKLAC
jgi:hypothetical protein